MKDIKEFLNIYKYLKILVALNTDELGIVVETNPETAFMLRPKVNLITDELGNKINGETVDLTEINPSPNRYKRTIVKSLNPHTYNIQIADCFLAM